MWSHTALIRFTVGNKISFFPSPFHVSTNPRLTLAGAFRNEYVATCSTALRSATEENESGGQVTVPCPSNLTQHSSAEDWLKFYLRHQIGCDGTHTEQIFTFKVTLSNNS